MSNTYTLFYSLQQRRQHEKNYVGSISTPGVYIFRDLRTNKEYAVTEFVRDRYILGFCLRGKSAWPDAERLATQIPADALRQVIER